MHSKTRNGSWITRTLLISSFLSFHYLQAPLGVRGCFTHAILRQGVPTMPHRQTKRWQCFANEATRVYLTFTRKTVWKVKKTRGREGGSVLLLEQCWPKTASLLVFTSAPYHKNKVATKPKYKHDRHKLKPQCCITDKNRYISSQCTQSTDVQCQNKLGWKQTTLNVKWVETVCCFGFEQP